MKHLLVSLLLLICSLTGSAQQTQPLLLAPVSQIHSSYQGQPIPHAQSVYGFYIDYDSADARIYTSSKYQRYVWPLNDHYTATDSAMRYCIVAFDSLFDTYGNIGYDHDSAANVAVDSIFLMIGQENNSGINDTIRIKLIAVDALHGYPDPTIVYWSTDVIIPFNAPLSGNWRMPIQLAFTPYASIYSSKFAIQLEYFGNKMDTLGIVAGFGFRDSCTTATIPDADTTHFSQVRKQSTIDSLVANSFVMWSQLQTFGLLPTRNGSNIFYDCNGNSQYDGGVDGESYIQNIQFMAHVKTNAAGVHELNNGTISVAQNQPNPFSDHTIIHYELIQNAKITLNVFDVSGKKMISICEGDMTKGKHDIDLRTSELEAGIYFYTISSDLFSVTRKMVLIR